jgi:hypothetical protein
VELGPVVGVVTGIAGLVYFLLGRKPKRLAYKTVANQPLITSNQYTDSGALEVRYKDEAVKLPRLITVSVVNTGKTEVREVDYDEPLTLVLGDEARSVAPSISLYDHRSSAGRALDVAEDSTRNVIAPKVLLNPGDRIEFTVLVDGAVSEPTVHARIAGTKIQKSVDQSTSGWKMGLSNGTVLTALAVSVAALLIVIDISLERSDVTVPDVTGVSINAAANELCDSSLRVGQVTYEATGLPTGEVVRVALAGWPVSRGMAIDLVLSWPAPPPATNTGLPSAKPPEAPVLPPEE